MKLLTALTLTSISNIAFAHTGHITHDSIHGFLHFEHLVIIGAIGSAIFLYRKFSKQYRNGQQQKAITNVYDRTAQDMHRKVKLRHKKSR